MRGFTLLEILVSLAVVVLLTSALYWAYTGNLEAISVVREQEDAYQTARVVLDLMVRDLEAALTATASGVSPQGTYGLVGSSGELAGRPADRVSFTTSSHLGWREDAPETDLCEVGYGLEMNEDTGEAALFRREQFLPDADLEEGGEKVALAEDVVALEIRYQDEDGEELDAWEGAAGEQKGRLPRSIRLRLSVRDQAGRKTIFRTGVHPALESGGGGR